MATLDGLDLGTFGIYTFDFEHLPAAQMREAIQELEAQGWGAFWFPELLGREAISHASLLLSSTETIRIVNAIAVIGSRGPQWARAAGHLLADAYPDRHVLGFGIGGVPADTSPLKAMTGYLDEIDAIEPLAPPPVAPMRRLVAAYGPKMLALARDRAAGATAYHTTIAHTEQARAILGPEKFLGVEQAVLLESDPARARAIAREHLVPYLTSPYNIAKFLRLGYTEAEIAGGGSDRIVDDLVFWGDLDTITAKLHEHVAAGADHVAPQVIGVAPGAEAMAQWRLLADALLP
jgi:probable F420-dependent oxidoreductase